MRTVSASTELWSPALEVFSAARWYAAYVCVRHEKKVAAELEGREVEFLLPLYRARRRWNRRQVEVDLPLFPGYVFVRIPLADRLRVLTVPGVVHLVGSGGKPAPLEDEEISGLRASLGRRSAEPHPYLAAGKRVRIQSGPLRGLQGVVAEIRGKWRMIVSIDSIAQSIAIEVDACDLTLAA